MALSWDWNSTKQQGMANYLYKRWVLRSSTVLHCSGLSQDECCWVERCAVLCSDKSLLCVFSNMLSECSALSTTVCKNYLLLLA